MPTYPRYLSFPPGELEARLLELGRASGGGPSNVLLPARPSTSPSPGRSRLLKNHSCSVRFPDGRAGCCRYIRGGPAWHIFHYDYEDGSRLPTQHETKRLENDVASIELAARERAALSFAEAITRERKEYFQRVSESAGRRKHPERFQMKALRAKALSGKYAVCQSLGKRLLPVGKMHDRLEDANREWQEEHESRPFLVIACCNRLDRCWEIPRFNPLYAVKSLRPQTPGPATAGTADTIPAEDDWEFLPGPDETDESEEDEP